MTRESLSRADEELVTFFTCSLGPKVQSLEPSGAQSGPGDFDRAIVRELDDAAMRSRPTRTRIYDAVAETLSGTDPESRRVIETVYTPCGTGFVPPRKSSEARARRRRGRDEDDLAPDFLAIALTPKWGGGSFVRLALRQDRALRAFAKRWPDKTPTHAAVLEFLVFEAGMGSGSATFFRQLRDDCEGPRSRALGAYDELRSARVDREAREARERRARAEAASAAMFEAALESKTRQRRERFERMLAGALS